MENPYTGQEPYGQAWDLGYQYGRANTGESDPSPPDFSGWDLDADTRVSTEQVWREGALAGREDAAAPAPTDPPVMPPEEPPPSGGTSELPTYDESTDTLYASSEDFPALVELVQAGDIDTWLASLGVDPALFADDPNV